MSDLGIPYMETSEWNEPIDFVLIAVPDEHLIAAAQTVSSEFPIVYPSGSTDWNLIDSNNKAVLWGIYSFIHHREIDYHQVPFSWEASNDQMTEMVMELMQPFKDQLVLTNQTQRTKAHMAAVFSNNFVSTLYQIAFDILEEEQLPPQLIIATIQQLAEKLKTESPKSLQTGPAKRNDLTTLKKHIALLENQPQKETIYRLMSNYILEKYGHPKL